MSRESSMLRVMDANVRLQKYMAEILAAKALELSHAQSWMHEYRQPNDYSDYLHQFNDAIALHRKIVEVIDGISSVEKGLASNLELLLDLNGVQGGFDLDSFSAADQA